MACHGSKTHGQPARIGLDSYLILANITTVTYAMTGSQGLFQERTPMKWLILVYRLPRSKTTATKVGTWRKLRKLGVFPLQDSVCVLPSSEKTLHSLDWLAAELRELGGDASLWEAEALTESQERDLREYFLEQVNIHYRKIMEEAAKAESIQEIKSLWMRFHRIKDQDHLKSPLSIQAEAACKARAADLAREEEPK